MPADLKYQLRYERHLLFSNRVRYYCRLTDNAVADHLRQAFSTADPDQGEYVAAYLLKLTREAVATLIADAVKRRQDLTVTYESLTDFNHNRREKEYLVILHYIIASLVRCRMEMQQRYQYVCDQSDWQDVVSYYASHVGWIHDPIVTAFYNKLIAYGQIPADTDQKHLFAIFSGRHTQATVTWLGKPATLKTILTKLRDNGKICTWPKDYSFWDVITQRFKDKDGNPMKNLSSYKEGNKTKGMVADIISALS